MIKTLQEVEERFDAIKDHKPKASKKLNELGEILASAYKIDADRADEMWQYLVDLNVSEDVTNSKFYIAQVFNKVSMNLKADEAAHLVAMHPERVQLMLQYGYDGGTLWSCLSTLIKGFLLMNSIENCMVTLDYFFDKFGGIYSDFSEVKNGAVHAVKASLELLEEKKIQKDTVARLLKELQMLDNSRIQAYAKLMLVVAGIEECSNYEDILDLAIENNEGNCFIELLWLAKNDLDEEVLIDKWLEYCENSDDSVMPHPELKNDSDSYEKSKLKWYVDILIKSEELLDIYFFGNACYSLEEGVIRVWIENGKWENFAQCIGRAIIGTDNRAACGYWWREVKNYIDCYFYSDYMDMTDDYGRSYKIINDNNLKSFEEALATISAMTVGCEGHESIHEEIKEFMEKASGNVDALNNVGFNESVDERGAEDKLREYIHDFLMSGEEYHSYNQKLSKLERQLHDEIWKSSSGESTGNVTIKIDITNAILRAMGVEVEETEDEEQNDEQEQNPQLEANYKFANDDEFVEFYFLHVQGGYQTRESYIEACIKKNDVNRAMELIDKLFEVKKYDNYEEQNGWGYQCELTLKYLIGAFDRNESYRCSENVTDEMVAVCRQLVERAIPNLPEKSRNKIKNELLKIAPDEGTDEAYIAQLLEDLEVYTTFPRPRGKGGAPNINRISDEFIDSFKILSKMGRLDIVVQIMTKFASVRDILKPVQFDSWMSFLARNLPNEDLVSVYRMNPEIFEAWIQSDRLREWNILNIAEALGAGCTRDEFISFRNMIIRFKGQIDGLDAAFKSTSENTETQLLFDGENAKIELDFLEVEGANPVNYLEFHLLTTVKNQDVDSVRVVSGKINGIEVEEIGAFSEYDDNGPSIGYDVYGRDSEDTLTVYSDFFETNDIVQVNRIEFEFVLMDEEGNSIENMSATIIERENSTGEYVVKAKALSRGSSINTYESDSEDDDEDEFIAETDAIQYERGDVFEDVDIYNEEDVIVQFCGVEFYSSYVELSLWCDSSRDETTNFFIKSLLVNGNSIMHLDFVGAIDEWDSGYLEIDIYGDEDFDYDEIKLIVGVDDENNKELGKTNEVCITLDVDEETYSVHIKE